mmetsp:Transcript_47122/g.134469  ORF Transcript_47122/g.134469 Transcript_47122/m.134469 type:complete len:214 (-) Transcript_47122:1242-1883(-)
MPSDCWGMQTLTLHVLPRAHLHLAAGRFLSLQICAASSLRAPSRRSRVWGTRGFRRTLCSWREQHRRSRLSPPASLGATPPAPCPSSSGWRRRRASRPGARTSAAPPRPWPRGSGCLPRAVEPLLQSQSPRCRSRHSSTTPLRRRWRGPRPPRPTPWRTGRRASSLASAGCCWRQPCRPRSPQCWRRSHCGQRPCCSEQDAARALSSGRAGRV